MKNSTQAPKKRSSQQDRAHFSENTVETGSQFRSAFQFRLLLLVFALVAMGLWFWRHRSGELHVDLVDAVTREAVGVAEIQLDDQKPVSLSALSDTAVLAGVKPGKHLIRVRARGYQNYEHVSELEAGEQLKVEFLLTPQKQELNAIGPLSIAAFQNPNHIAWLDASMQILRNIPLPTPPLDVVTLKDQVFVLLQGQDAILNYSLETTKLIRKIDLPPFSGPQRLLLSSEGTLLVLNTVGKSLSILEVGRSELSKTIPLPISFTDLEFESGQQSVVASGLEGLIRIAYRNGLVGPLIPHIADMSMGISLQPGSEQFFVPYSDGLVLLNLVTERFEEWDVPIKMSQLRGINTSRVILAGQNKILLYDLFLKQMVGNTLEIEGDPHLIEPWGEDWILATRSPSRIYRLKASSEGLKAIEAIPYTGTLIALVPYNFK